MRSRGGLHGLEQPHGRAPSVSPRHSPQRLQGAALSRRESVSRLVSHVARLSSLVSRLASRAPLPRGVSASARPGSRATGTGRARPEAKPPQLPLPGCLPPHAASHTGTTSTPEVRYTAGPGTGRGDGAHDVADVEGLRAVLGRRGREQPEAGLRRGDRGDRERDSGDQDQEEVLGGCRAED